jgi:heparan-alpha-glucosaminide N-acetyltransferase
MSASTELSFPRLTTNVLATQRIYTIDALRGITILVMIFVNELAGVGGLPGWMKHAAADADSMTFVDVVFPSFLFIVGMSVPFAISARLSKESSLQKLMQHTLSRTIGLLVLGVFMVNAEGGFDEQSMAISLSLWSLLFCICAILVWNQYTFPNKTISLALRLAGVLGLIALAFLYKSADGGGMKPQWWGILGLIGWAYLFSTVFYLISRGMILPLLLIILLCIVFFFLGDEYGGSGNSFFAFLSSQKGHATHTAIVLCGVVVSLLVFDQQRNKTLPRRFMEVGAFAMACTIIGVLLRPLFSISKIYATPSWALFSVAICVAVFAFLYWLIDYRRIYGWTSFIPPAASNPLLTYLIPYIIIALMGIFHVSRPGFFSHGAAGFIWSLCYAFAVMAFVILLNRFKIKLQL